MGLGILLSILFLSLVFFFTNTLYSPLEKSNSFKKEDSKTEWICFFVFLGFLLFRLLLAVFSSPYTSDMSCWIAWGNRFIEVGPENFYAPDYFCDYPPGYIYILGFVARLMGILGVPTSANNFFFRLPAILGDMLLFFSLYSFTKKFWRKNSALLIGGIFLLTPIFWYDSAVWGQIESILLAFLVVSILRLYEKKYFSAILYYVLAILIKPQGLILAPIYLVALLETRNIKTIVSCALGGVALFLICSLPFSSVWQTETGFSAFLQSLKPLWLIEKYQNTLASYPYFSVNAFNLYGLLGLNWVSMEGNYSWLLSLLNIVIMGLAVFASLYVFYKVKNQGSRLFLSAYVLLGFLYTFAFKMHERYVILPLFFLLLDFIISKNRKILYLFAGLSSVCFLNLCYVLQLNLSGNTAPLYAIVAPLSFLEVLLFVTSLFVIYRDSIKDPGKSNENKHWIFFSNLKYWNVLSGKQKPLQKQRKMNWVDYYLLAGIVFLYSLAAFLNLGDTKAPQTYYQPKNTGETFYITLEEPIVLSEINYYCGIGEIEGSSGLELSTSLDGKNWTILPETYGQLKSVFHWEKQEISPVETKYIKGIAKTNNYTLYEIGFRDINGNLANVSSLTGENQENLLCMADEQHLVKNQPSYMNGTYFDEIYHPRTAYEHLHGLPYYETTHPPLGKLIMAVGVGIFGMTPFGWRFAGTFIGICMLPIFYLFLKRLFGRTRYSVIGTLLFAFDFMHFSLTRIGTIDTYPVFFILCMYYFMYEFGESAVSWARDKTTSRKKQLLYLGLSGLSMGLGCASKWTAVYAGIGLAIEYIVIQVRVYRHLSLEEKRKYKSFLIRTSAWCLLFFVLVPSVVYTLSYLPISMVDGYGNVFEAMWNNQKYMFDYHSKLKGTHPYSSPWYSWPFVYKPMWAYQAPADSIGSGQIGCISIFQNPILSWFGIAAIFYSLYRGIKKCDFRVLFLFLGMLAQYLPWMFVTRYALQYHFFGTLPFMILFIVYSMEDLEERFEKAGYISSGFTILCLLMFLAFYPVISGVPVSRVYVETFLSWFDSWVFFV